MKPLRDCEFSAFISYAHADDAAWFDWVTQFRNELERGLAALLRGVRLPRMHLSGENGPVAGMLSDELKERVAASFAMIIVVHDNYAQSDWCFKELEYFQSLFGEEGLRQRLYIVAMSEAAMLAVSHGAAWQRVLGDRELVWAPFYDSADKNRPLDIYLGAGLVSPAFRVPFERLRGDLAAKLRKSAQEPPAQGLPQPPRASADVPLPLPEATDHTSGGALAAAGVVVLAEPALAAGPRVAFGFVPPASADAAAQALAVLTRQGLAVQALQPAAVLTDFAELAEATHLVLPFDDTPPMLGALAGGGHLQLLREAWLKKGRAADALLWLDLRQPPPLGPWQGGAAYVAGLGQAALTPAEVLARLQPAAQPPAQPGTGLPVPQGVRIYIESNRHERTLWEPLGEQIRVKWEEVCSHLAPGRVPPLSLRTRGLPVDQIDSFPSLDDADGVVLLWGRKTSDALVAQINKVENKMAPGRDAAPGIVAYLMPPQAAAEPIPAWGWQVLRFNAADEQCIDVVEEERDELRRFLQKVFKRCQQRNDASGS